MLVALERRGAAAAVFGMLAVPGDRPPLSPRRSHQRLGSRVWEEVATEVGDDQSAVGPFAEITEDECLGADHGAMDSVGPLLSEDRVLTPQAEQIAMECQNLRSRRLFGRVEFRRNERFGGAGVGEVGNEVGMSDAPEHGQEFVTPLEHQPRQVVNMVCEIEERVARAVLLPLKEHRGFRAPEARPPSSP